MSRVGKQPINVPQGVSVDYKAPQLVVKGGKSTLSREIHPKVDLKIDDSVITVVPLDESREARALWGLTRSLVNNMVVGVSSGFTRVLEIIGEVSRRGKAQKPGPTPQPCPLTCLRPHP